jgi:hypothetical protein
VPNLANVSYKNDSEKVWEVEAAAERVSSTNGEPFDESPTAVKFLVRADSNRADFKSPQKGWFKHRTSASRSSNPLNRALFHTKQDRTPAMPRSA